MNGLVCDSVKPGGCFDFDGGGGGVINTATVAIHERFTALYRPAGLLPPWPKFGSHCCLVCCHGD